MDTSDNEESNLDICPNEIEEVVIKTNGEEFTKKYIKGKFLGKGGFAKCYEFECINNKKIYAAKIVCKANLTKSSAKQKLKSEIKIHKSLFYKHIVKFEHVFEDKENVYILLELCKNKTLNEIMKKRKIITELETKYFLEQILKAVNFMHTSRIIHRDLKLGNLFLNDDFEIKIGDFGLATIIEYEGQLRHTVCGTPNYIAPEILEGKNSGHSYEVDFWAIGVIVYTLLVGKPPYETDDVKETYKRIKANQYTYPNNIYVSNDAKDFISKLLVVNPNDRYNIEQMRNHPFMKKIPAPKKIYNGNTLLNNIMENPLDSAFIRHHLIDSLNIKSVLDESKIINNKYYLTKQDLENMLVYAKDNVIKVNNSTVNKKFYLNKEDINYYVNRNKEISSKIRKYSTSRIKNIDPIVNMRYLENYNELSFNKQYNNTVMQNTKITYNELFIKYNVCYVLDMIDLSNSIGIIYLTNKGIIGIIFKDKTMMFKLLYNNKLKEKSSSNNMKNNIYAFRDKNICSNVQVLDRKSNTYIFDYKYGNQTDKSADKNNNNEKEMKEKLNKHKLKVDLLFNVENTFKEKEINLNYKELYNSYSNFKEKDVIEYLKLNSDSIYAVKYLVSEMAYFLKLSNNFINCLFYDGSKLLVGTQSFPYIVFWNKKNEVYYYSIHQVNKSKNKNMLKRYDHYKKIFYEKLEIRMSNKVGSNDDNTEEGKYIPDISDSNILEINSEDLNNNEDEDINKTL